MENINNNDVIISFSRFSFNLSTFKVFIINALILCGLFFIGIGANINLINENEKINKLLIALLLVLVIMTIIRWITVKHYINYIFISNNRITIKWQNKWKDYSIELPPNAIESTPSIQWGKGNDYSHLKLSFEHEDKPVELKQYVVGKWKIDTIKMVDNAIKEAQANLIKENS